MAQDAAVPTVSANISEGDVTDLAVSAEGWTLVDASASHEATMRGLEVICSLRDSRRGTSRLRGFEAFVTCKYWERK